MGRGLLWAGGFFRGGGKRITSCFHTLLAPIPHTPNNLPKVVEGRLGAKAVGWKKFLFSKFKGGEVQKRESWGGKM